MMPDLSALSDAGQWILALVTGLLATGIVWLYDRWRWWNNLKAYHDDFVRIESKQYGGGPDHDLQRQTIMRLVKIRYTGYRLLSITTKYWPDMSLAQGRVEFASSKFVGNGNFWYTDRTSWGRWVVELYPDSFPDEVRMYYDGTQPEVRGYEVLIRRSKLRRELLPVHLQKHFEEFSTELDAEFSNDRFAKRQIPPAKL